MEAHICNPSAGKPRKVPLASLANQHGLGIDLQLTDCLLKKAGPARWLSKCHMSLAILV